MKRLISLVFILLMLPVLCSADWYDAPFSPETALWPAEIPAKSVCVNPGTYTVGQDIPAGYYQIDTDSFGCKFSVKSDKGSNLFSDFIGKNYRCTRIRIPLCDGYTVKIDMNPVYFSKSGPVDLDHLYPGIYFSGEDIPSGSYFFHSNSPYTSTVFIKPGFGSFPVSSERTKIDIPDGSFVIVYGFPLTLSECTDSYDWSVLE